MILFDPRYASWKPVNGAPGAIARGVEGLHYVEHLEAYGEALFAKVLELDLEGIVAKLADSPYRAGRQPTWVKVKNRDYWRREAVRFRC